MGNSPSNSVIDAHHRIWSVPNVYVADGSVCPTQGNANPALTIIALASRLAAHLASHRPDSSSPPPGKFRGGTPVSDQRHLRRTAGGRQPGVLSTPTTQLIDRGSTNDRRTHARHL